MFVFCAYVTLRVESMNKKKCQNVKMSNVKEDCDRQREMGNSGLSLMCHIGVKRTSLVCLSHNSNTSCEGCYTHKFICTLSCNGVELNRQSGFWFIQNTGSGGTFVQKYHQTLSLGTLFKKDLFVIFT